MCQAYGGGTYGLVVCDLVTLGAGPRGVGPIVSELFPFEILSPPYFGLKRAFPVSTSGRSYLRM